MSLNNIFLVLMIKNLGQHKFMNFYNSNDKFVLCGDFNYDDVNTLFPQIMRKCKDLINEPTRKDKQLWK